MLLQARLELVADVNQPLRTHLTLARQFNLFTRALSSMARE